MRGLIYNQLIAVKDRIHEYETEFNRPLNSVFLLAVSKGRSIEAIKEAIETGQRAFGENYLQEALIKIQALRDYLLEWHFIGAIQSNKTKKIAEHFAWAQTVSSVEIAKKLNNYRSLDLPPLNICLQVNISEEHTKSGTSAAETLALAEACQALPRLKLRGLMAIPKAAMEFDKQLAQFNQLAILFNELNRQGHQLDTLSMGMSYDLHAAIAAGSTMVRVGRAIFLPSLNR